IALKVQFPAAQDESLLPCVVGARGHKWPPEPSSRQGHCREHLARELFKPASAGFPCQQDI
ncbi:MAG: hypothetical protein PVH65_18630, partial [Chloroflexota bacterium]